MLCKYVHKYTITRILPHHRTQTGIEHGLSDLRYCYSISIDKRLQKKESLSRPKKVCLRVTILWVYYIHFFRIQLAKCHLFMKTFHEMPRKNTCFSYRSKLLYSFKEIILFFTLYDLPLTEKDISVRIRLVSFLSQVNQAAEEYHTKETKFHCSNPGRKSPSRSEKEK